MPVLTEHRLRIGGRRFTLLEGPAGWGECSPLAGYPCDPGAARRAAEEAATIGFPAAVRDEVAVNALVRGRGFDAATFDRAALAGYGCVKVKVGYPGDVDVVAAVRDAVGPAVSLRVDANGAWDVDTAVARLGALSRYDIELAEQPVASIEDLAARPAPGRGAGRGRRVRPLGRRRAARCARSTRPTRSSSRCSRSAVCAPRSTSPRRQACPRSRRR